MISGVAQHICLNPNCPNLRNPIGRVAHAFFLTARISPAGGFQGLVPLVIVIERVGSSSSKASVGDLTPSHLLTFRRHPRIQILSFLRCDNGTKCHLARYGATQPHYGVRTRGAAEAAPVCVAARQEAPEGRLRSFPGANVHMRCSEDR